MADLFEEIDKARQELPKMNNIRENISKYKLNGYQLVSVVTFSICFFLGIILGNLFPACGKTSGLFTVCTNTEFNISLTLFVWFVSFLICLLFYGLGHIIYLLSSINDKLQQKK